MRVLPFTSPQSEQLQKTQQVNFLIFSNSPELVEANEIDVKQVMWSTQFLKCDIEEEDIFRCLLHCMLQLEYFLISAFMDKNALITHYSKNSTKFQTSDYFTGAIFSKSTVYCSGPLPTCFFAHLYLPQFLGLLRKQIRKNMPIFQIQPFILYCFS